MVDVSGQHTSELLVDEPVNDPSVHDSSSDDDDLGREKQGDVEAQLGQVVTHQFPDPRVLDLLWADPAPNPGHTPSKRGASMAFGPDITKRFLQENGLSTLFSILRRPDQIS